MNYKINYKNYNKKRFLANKRIFKFMLILEMLKMIKNNYFPKKINVPNESGTKIIYSAKKNNKFNKFNKFVKEYNIEFNKYLPYL